MWRVLQYIDMTAFIIIRLGFVLSHHCIDILSRISICYSSPLLHSHVLTRYINIIRLTSRMHRCDHYQTTRHEKNYIFVMYSNNVLWIIKTLLRPSNSLEFSRILSWLFRPITEDIICAESKSVMDSLWTRQQKNRICYT